MSDRPPKVGPVMTYTSRRGEVERFYFDIVGLPGKLAGDATWLEAENAQLVIHDPFDQQTPAEVRGQSGFVVWFAVDDVRAAYDRARNASVAVSDFYGDYFFARDPDGRYVGIYALEDHGHGHDHEH